ncbi:NUDIX hydrolase [bacterium]|nr:NUDIX hydrolase [bacterium]
MKLLNRTTIYKGYCFDLYEDQVIWVNRRELKRSLIKHSGISVMLPLLDSDRLILINQYRYGVQDNIWELPAGTINIDETPLECAQREIEEEIGYQAKNWKQIASCYSSPHFSTEIVHSFIAEDLIKTETNRDADEIIEMRTFSKQEVKQMLSDGQIRDAKTLVTLYTYFNNI